MKTASMAPIKTYYYDIANAGDQLTAIIVKQLLNRDVVWANSVQCDLIGIGSILECKFVRPPDSLKNRVRGIGKFILAHDRRCYVWSSGFMCRHNVRPIKTYFSNLTFSAVRGKLTKEHIEKIHRPIPDTVLADGGLLSSLLQFDGGSAPSKKTASFPIGIIPHHTEMENEHIHKLLAQYKNVNLINMQNDPLTVIREISTCETILSSSLHGLIIADSFGIPNMPIVVSPILFAQKFKFDDYYSSFDAQYTPLDLLNAKEFTFPSVNDIIDKYEIDYSAVQEKQKQLLACFPKELL